MKTALTTQNTAATTAPAAWQQSSQQLMQCLIDVERGAPDAKMELIALTSELMPGGTPAFANVRHYPTIAQLITQHSRKTMMKVVCLLIRDFCQKMNVVRNMTSDQMMEAAAMLLDECGNFRLEDYTMMFALAKRGQLVKIYDRIDISIISSVMDEYYALRSRAGQQLYEQEERERENAWQQPPLPPTTPQEQADSDRFTLIAQQMDAVQQQLDAEKKLDYQDYLKRREESFETLKKVNMEEVVRVFGRGE